MRIAVERTRLLEVLKTNRAEHRHIFDEALEGYRKLTIKRFEQAIDRIKRGETIEEAWRIPRPTDHTADYDHAVSLLEMGVDDTIELTEEDVAQYVHDDWGWQRAFLASSGLYSRSAGDKLRRDYGERVGD